MGAYLSTSRNSSDESESQNASGAYRFPPKSGGSYFSNHFIMGGEKFDTPNPEAFLFGETSDLNFLGPRPAPFPYPPPQATEPTKTLRSLINIRRDSVHISPIPGQVSIPNCPTYDSDADEYQQQRICDESQRIWALHRERKYNLNFTFDSDVRCAITIYYFCTEEISPIAATYNIETNPHGFKSETYYYKRGANQQFNQPSHVIQPGSFKDTDLAFHENEDNVTVVPVAIQCVALDGDSPRQAHTTVASFERTNEGAYVLKNIKQKLYVDGLSYLLQEIYGLENKSADLPKFDDEFDDCGADCVVCMCDLRDTIILPCRHLCLCYACAESLRYQASNCPICRAPFIALLQIRAVQKMSHNSHPALAGTEPTAQEGVPPGYNSISLVEALNGPNSNRQPQENIAVAAPAVNSEPSSQNQPSSSNSADSNSRSRKNRGKRRGSTSSKSQQNRLSSSTLNEESEPISEETPDQTSSSIVKVKSADTNVRVSLKIVNEIEEGGATKPLDIVEEELAKMAVAESLNDIPNEVNIIQDIDEEIEDNSTSEDEAGQEGDDELEEDNEVQKSERSSASSAGSTKKLLDEPEPERKTTPLQHESKIVMVKSTEDDDEDDHFC